MKAGMGMLHWYTVKLWLNLNIHTVFFQAMTFKLILYRVYKWHSLSPI